MQKGGEKRGRPGIIHHVLYIKWTYGGCGHMGGVAQPQKKMLTKLCRSSESQLAAEHSNRADWMNHEQPSGPAETTTGPAPLIST